MQPLKIRLNPSSGSTIGCDPSTLRSMIDNRRWPNATGPRHQTPQPSGPRGDRTALIRSTAAMSAYSPSKRISPTSPHTRFSARARLRPEDAVFLLARDRRRCPIALFVRAACLPSLVVQTASGSALPTLAERSEEHTSELQSRQYLVCRLLLEK